MELERNRNEGSVDLADRQAEFSFEYGQKLKEQAEKNGLATIKTSPIETLFQRVLEILD